MSNVAYKFAQHIVQLLGAEVSKFETVGPAQVRDVKRFHRKDQSGFCIKWQEFCYYGMGLGKRPRKELSQEAYIKAVEGLLRNISDRLSLLKKHPPKKGRKK